MMFRQHRTQPSDYELFLKLDFAFEFFIVLQLIQLLKLRGEFSFEGFEFSKFGHTLAFFWMGVALRYCTLTTLLAKEFIELRGYPLLASNKLQCGLSQHQSP